MPSSLNHIAVVGGSLAGIRAVEALRRRGYEGRITWIAGERHLPYDRPPLSKQLLLGDWEPDRLRFRRSEGYDALQVDLRLDTRATRLDTKAQRITLTSGPSVQYDGLVIATGARARTLPGATQLEGVHVLRTLDDALAIRDAFARSPRVIVVGAGFIGLEVAACARQRGLDVVIVEAAEVPLGFAVGDAMGRLIARLHEDHGVRVLSGRSVLAVEGSGHQVERVRLSDGTELPADLVVVGIGVVPETEWLRGSDIQLADGVICDQSSATSVPNVVAAGDVARWHNPIFNESMRVEHWTNAVEQANAAVSRLLSGPESAAAYCSVPYFWSDQYTSKIQFAGRVRRSDEVRIVDGSPEDGRFVALYSRGGWLTGALAVNRPAQLIKYRQMLSQPVRRGDVLPS